MSHHANDELYDKLLDIRAYMTRDYDELRNALYDEDFSAAQKLMRQLQIHLNHYQELATREPIEVKGEIS